MIKQLMSSRRFAPLFWAQFCSALNDNVLKNALVIMLLYGAVAAHGDALVTVAGAVFIFPFFILSGLGGELADKYVKGGGRAPAEIRRDLCRRLSRRSASSCIRSRCCSWRWRMFGIVAALFGPVKYAMLPDQLTVGELATGNALVEGATFMAILIGTIAGGQLGVGLLAYGLGVARRDRACAALLGLGVAASRIPRRPRPICRVTANPWTSTSHLLKSLYAETAAVGRHGDRVLVLAGRRGRAVAAAGPGQGHRRRHRGRRHALPCGLRDRHRRSARCLPPSSAMSGPISRWCRSAPSSWAWSASISSWRSARPRRRYGITPAGFLRPRGRACTCWLDFALFAFGGGLFVVPSFAAVQAWSAPSERARVIAAGNVLQAAFMVVGSLVVAVLQAAGLPIAWIFFGLALASFGSVWFVLNKWGREGVRDFGALLVPGAVPHRGARPGEPAAGRHAHADRAQPCQPDRRPAAACGPADRCDASPSIPASRRPGGPSRS